MNTKVKKIIRAFRESEMQEAASVLLQRLDGHMAARQTAPKTKISETAAAKNAAAVVPISASERLQNELDALSLENGRAPAKRALQPETAQRKSAATGDTPAYTASSAAKSAAEAQESTPADAAGLQYAPTNGRMDEISEFFRRDSRRYDTGFGGRNR